MTISKNPEALELVCESLLMGLRSAVATMDAMKEELDIKAEKYRSIVDDVDSLRETMAGYTGGELITKSHESGTFLGGKVVVNEYLVKRDAQNDR